MKMQIFRGLSLGLAVALLGVILASTSAGRWLEEDIGLPWLFKFRGERPAPTDVVVISMDSRSSQHLGLPNKPRKWPRSLHGHLIDGLTENKVSSITFDVIFDEVRDNSDNLLFADAIQRAENVILYQYLKKMPIYQEDKNRKQQVIGIRESLIPPLPVLSDAALGLSLFPLPKVPARVNHFHLYTPTLDNVATLPVLSQLIYSLDEYTIFVSLLKQLLPAETASLPHNQAEVRSQKQTHILASQLRQIFNHHPNLSQQMTGRLAPNSSKLKSLINTLAMPNSAYLNFYGPPGSIHTIPYYQVLDAKPGSLDLAGKAVIVGFAEEFQPEQADAFYTVFTDPDSGLDISGVEIAATALANLIENSVLRVSSPAIDILILVCWGILLGVGLRLLPGQYIVPAAIAIVVLYSSLVYQQFANQFHWYPLAIPILFQAPLLVIGSLIWKYHDSQRERKNIRQAFGYHLPIDVVDQLAHGMDHITATGQHVHGIVMATDAAQYTRLSENMPPSELRNLMNRYYEILFTPIRQSEGIVSDVVGDAAMAIWASSKPEQKIRQQACHAAVEIIHAIDQFNQENPQHALPTRMGLHFGEMVMGHVGAVDHYEYRAVGDIVNTASRIEGLNKLLGTRIIVSEPVLSGVHGFVTRKLGNFVLVGKQQAITLYELVDRKDNNINMGYDLFEKALQACQTGQLETASTNFENFLRQNPDDGPTKYYLQLLSQNDIGEMKSTYEVIKLTQK